MKITKGLINAIIIAFAIVQQASSQQRTYSYPELYLAKGISRSQISSYGTCDIGVRSAYIVTRTEVIFYRELDLKEINRYPIPGIYNDSKVISNSSLLAVYKYQKSPAVIYLYDLPTGRKLDSLKIQSRAAVQLTDDSRYLISTKIDSVTITEIKGHKIVFQSTAGELLHQNKKNMRITSALFDPINDNLTIQVSRRSIYNFNLNGQLKSFYTGDIDDVFITNTKQVAVIFDRHYFCKLGFEQKINGILNPDDLPVADLNVSVKYNDNFLSKDGNYLFYKKGSRRESFDSVKTENGFKRKRVSNDYLYVFDIKLKTVTDSVKVPYDDRIFYDEVTKTIFFLNKYLSGSGIIHSYNLATKVERQTTDHLFDPVTQFSYRNETMAIVTKKKPYELSLLNLTNGMIKHITLRDADTAKYNFSNSKVVQSSSGKYIVLYSSNNLKIWDTTDVNNYSQVNGYIVNIVPGSADTTFFLRSYSDDIIKINAGIRPFQIKKLFHFNNPPDSSRYSDFGIVNDEIGYFWTHIFVNKRNKPQILNSRNSGINSKNDFLDSLYLVSLKTGDTLFSFSDRTAYPFLSLKEKKKSQIQNIGFNPQKNRIEIIGDLKSYAISIKDYKVTALDILGDSSYFYSGYLPYVGNKNKYYFSNNAGIITAFRLGRQGAQLQLAFYSNRPENIDDWLMVSKEGFFEGNSNVLNHFFWRDTVSKSWFSYDAYYNSFYTNNLCYKKLNDKLPHTLDIGFYTKIPGLSKLITDSLAVLKTIDNATYLCINKIDQLNPLLLHNNIGAVYDTNNKGCRLRIPVPKDVGNISNGQSNEMVKIKDSDIYFNKKKTGTLYVLSFAIGNYPVESKLDPLKNSNTASVNLMKTFKDHEKDITRIFENIKLISLEDRFATKQTFIDTLNYLFKHTKTDDFVIIYMIGHGSVPEGSEMFYFFPYDGINNDLYNIENSAINAAAISDIPNFFAANRILILIDACQSGGSIAALNKIHGNQKNKNLFSANVITSSFPITFSFQNQNGSVLTKLLVQSIAHSASTDKTLTMESLFKYVKFYGEKGKDTTIQIPLLFRTGPDFPIMSFQQKGN